MRACAHTLVPCAWPRLGALVWGPGDGRLRSTDLPGRPTFQPPRALGAGGGAPGRFPAPPLTFTLPAPPAPRRPAPPRASPLPPVTPMLTEALSGRRGAGWWLLPLRLQCALWLGAVGGAGDAGGACACDVAASVTFLPRPHGRRGEKTLRIPGGWAGQPLWGVLRRRLCHPVPEHSPQTAGCSALPRRPRGSHHR